MSDQYREYRQDMTLLEKFNVISRWISDQFDHEGLAQAVSDFRHDLSANGWIYCEDGLPEMGGEYLVSFMFNETPVLDIQSFDKSGKYWWSGMSEDVEHPYAWQPLPEPAQVRQ